MKARTTVFRTGTDRYWSFLTASQISRLTYVLLLLRFQLHLCSTAFCWEKVLFVKRALQVRCVDVRVCLHNRDDCVHGKCICLGRRIKAGGRIDWSDSSWSTLTLYEEHSIHISLGYLCLVLVNISSLATFSCHQICKWFHPVAFSTVTEGVLNSIHIYSYTFFTGSRTALNGSAPIRVFVNHTCFTRPMIR